MIKFITLTTDFGLEDGYAGILKGVIWKIAPDAQIADLSHTISPQNILEGVLTLGDAAPYFPEGTIHLAVVDPGVGTSRRPIAAHLGYCYFVGPDNGLVTLLLKQADRQRSAQNTQVEFVHLDQPRYWLQEISSTFHGRDIFAPVAAHLANGVALSALGTSINNPVLIDIPLPQPLDRGWRGRVIHIDHFGNVATNIERRHILAFDTLIIRCSEHVVRGVAQSYGDGEPGKLIAIIDSSDRLALCVVNGDASRRLQVRLGDVVDVLAQV